MPSTHPVFAFDRFLLRQKLFSLFGNRYYIDREDGSLIGFVKQKKFKLREDIRVYTDESMQSELLLIAARAILDWQATYDVKDALTGEVAGSLRRKGLRSIVRDEWVIFDAFGRELGRLQEDSTAMALLRRMINFIPQKFAVQWEGRAVGRVRQHFNPFMLRMTADFSEDPGRTFDRRLAIAAVVLLATIEGRQE